MSTTRLTFLYPQLFRAPRLGETATQAAQLARRRTGCTSPPSTCQKVARYATATSPKQSTYVTRHGKAVEPIPLSGDSKAPPSQPPPSPKSGPQTPEQKGNCGAGPEPNRASGADETKGAAAADKSRTTPTDDGKSPIPSVIELGAPSPPPPSSPPPPPPPASGEGAKHKSGPMETILHMPSPESLRRQHPHLSPPPYVHHFDTYSLVKQLETGGYTQEQAITAMKAVRALLAQNLDVAQSGLVSRRDVDNETYLFRAACSELSTEVKNNRRIADEQMRQQRTHVQHEVDILTQGLNQELLTLNDNVKGMFNDRRMAVREEQKAAESVIQQINYKISVTLNSDAKSDIEGLRWVLIRRGVLGLIFMALISLGALRYVSYAHHERQMRSKKAAEEAEMLRRNDGKLDRSSAPDAAGILAAN